MKCNCNLFLDQCMWPGQCELLGHWIEHRDDMVTQDRGDKVTENWPDQFRVKIENYGEYFEGLGELQTKNPWIMQDLSLDDYFERIVNPTVAKYERKETKMTRDEALEKVNAPVYAEKLVSALEALGLIKFEEEKTVEQVVIDAGYNLGGVTYFLQNLDKHGYKIVKK